jgi:membrane fusion protein (multidrug efflux system)
MLIIFLKKYFTVKNIYLKCKRTVCSALTFLLLAAVTSAFSNNLPLSPLASPDSALQTNSSTPEYVVIKPSDQATFSSDTAANVANVLVQEGSRFHTGDVLLQLDCRLQQADLKKALAQQTEAKAAQEAAKKLKSYGSISEFEAVKAASEEQVANAEVDKLHTMVDKCVIKAPFNGAVSEVMVHAHESVKTGDPLLKIVNTENLEFEIQIPSQWLAWLHVGSIFYVHLNEENKTISAKITKINPQIEPVSQSVKIIGTITPPDATLLPGMSGQAIFRDNPSSKKATSKN